jgi:UDP-N-acetylmuramate dehydrogenase
VTVPGTIGGAVRGNAGCYGGEMKDVVKKVQVLRGGQVLDLSLDDLKFAYRESLIKHSKDIILSVSFELRPGDSESLKQKIEEQIRKRKASQPFYAGSAGCIFKNYEIKKDELDRLKKESDIPEEMIAKGQISTGWLVDQMDLKGKQIDGVKISDEHGNFIINLGNGRASDVVQLISIIKMQARDRFGLALEEEVEYLGF